MSNTGNNEGNEFYRELVLGFRMTQLQQLLVFAGQTRSGKKGELQERVLNLLEKRSKTLHLKIKELSKQQRRFDSQSDQASDTQGGKDAKETVYSNPYTSPIMDSTASCSSNVLPKFPDVELKPLPFFDILSVLMKPCSLQPKSNARFQEQTLEFHLTPAQASSISQSSYRNDADYPVYRKQIQLRFSLLETSCHQEDNFPQSISVKVNSRLCPLPPVIPTNKTGIEPRRQPKPVNITALSKLVATSPNTVTVSWAEEAGKAFTASIYLVDNLTHQDLLNRLKAKGERDAGFTKALIKEKLKDQDQEIATTSCKVSLACPLGKMRMSLPCRPSYCDHLQTFDARLFLQLNEKNPKWKCPVCNKAAEVDNLMIDGFFMELLKSPRLPADEHEIVLHNDGTWDPKPHEREQEDQVLDQAENEKETECVPIDDSDTDDDTEATSEPSAAVPKKRRISECITLDSDSDDNEQEEVAKEAKRPNQPPSSPDLIILD